MSGFEVSLLRPYWLVALPILATIAWWLHRQTGAAGDWERAVNPALFQALQALGRIEGAASQHGLYATLSVSTLVVLALAGPAIERRDTLSFRNLDGVVFVLDASQSITTAERWPQMLTMGRFGVTALGSRPAALVVFSGDAYIATDMTQDVRQLGQTMSLISPETVPDPGSRPERGLALARGVFEQAQLLSGDVILMTDGAGLGPGSLREAAALVNSGARVSIVALATPAQAMVSLAQIGQGRIFTLDQTDALASWIADDARTRLVRQNFPLLYWQDIGRYLLVMAMVPLLTLFRRRSS